MSRGRQLNPTEQERCKQRMLAWLNESGRWAQDFQDAIPSIQAIGEAYNENQPVPNREKLISSATYFLFTAGAVYYHALEIAQSKMGYEAANRWFSRRRSRKKVLKQLHAMRNLLTHGALYDSEDQEFTFLITTGPDKTLAEAYEAALANPGVHIGFGLSLKLEWWDRKDETKESVLEWQQAALAELKELAQEVI